LSLKAAREKREKCRQWLAGGLDPKTELELSTEETLKPVTVQDALEYWLVNYARRKRSDEELVRAQLRKHIYPRLVVILSRCETRHWVACFDEINQTKPMTAGRMFQISKQALRFCKVRRYAASDALAFLTIQDVGQPSGQRDRVLSDSELADVWRCTDSDDQQPYYSRLLKMCSLVRERWRFAFLDGQSGILPRGFGQYRKSTAKLARKS
jgi:hypothetical protein